AGRTRPQGGDSGRRGAARGAQRSLPVRQRQEVQALPRATEVRLPWKTEKAGRNVRPFSFQAGGRHVREGPCGRDAAATAKTPLPAPGTKRTPANPSRKSAARSEEHTCELQ